MRRVCFSFAILVSLGIALPSAAGGLQEQPPAAPAGGAGGRTPEGPRPYRDVITSLAVSDSGVFLIHRINEKLFYEIPRALWGREFRLVADQRGTTRGLRYAGEQVTARVVRWERIGNKVLLRLVNYQMQADTSLPVARAVNLSNLGPIIMAFDVAAWAPDSSAVLEVTRLFTSDVAELNIRQNMRVRRFDPARSIVERARSFPRNIEVSALQTFEVDSVPAPVAGQGPDRSLNSVTILMNYSMLLLPAAPMQPRLCDNRVGFFSVQFEDYGYDDPRVQRRCFITRWRLEPKDPAAAVSDPVKPIVFYLDPATPEKWVPWLIKGVKAWEPVFRAAGFSNAIDARRAPSRQEDPDFDLDDMRYSTIRWLPSVVENAYGPHVNDPRSGEILQSDIGWYHNVTALLESWYWTQAGAVDPRARQLPFPDSLMGEMVAYVATHEVGHTLGLPHNQLSSGLYPVDSLRSPSYTRRHGTSYTIMDYARNNFVAQPGDDVQLMPTLGEWDFYAIQWGYGRTPQRGAEAERPYLDSLAREQDSKPWLRFGNPDGIDPRTQTEALGDDPVKAATYGVANIKRLVPMLIPATTTRPLRDYTLLNTLYGELIAQWAREMGHVAVVVGGVYRHEKYPNQPGVIHTPVPRDRQAAAVRFLNEQVFRTPTYFFDPEVLRRIEPSGFVDRVRTRQAAILSQVLEGGRLGRLVEQDATLPRGTAYPVVDLFRDLRSGIFSEMAAQVPVIDPYRRNLQRAFLEEMDELINPPPRPAGGGTGAGPAGPPPPPPGDAVAVARLELQTIDAALRSALPRVTDRATRAHLVDLQARIRKTLDPSS